MQVRKTVNQSKTMQESFDPILSRVQSIQSRNIKQSKQSMKNITEIREHNLENLNEEEIDKIIKQSRGAKKQFARTDLESYQPLTKKQKFQALVQLNHESDKRIHVYSELFKEIKTQINSLSNISTNVDSKLQSTLNLRLSMDDIKEVEDSDDEEIDKYNTLKDLSSPTNNTTNKSFGKAGLRITPKNNLRLKIMNPTQSRGLFDWKDSEENIGMIHIPQMNYKSNSIQAVDSISGHITRMKYKTTTHV
jgi:hypothetical protein